MHDTAEAATKRHASWTPARRFAFRAVVAYFGLFLVGLLLDSGPGPRAVLAALSVTPFRWFGRTILRLTGSPNDGGAAWAVAQQIVALLVAVAIGGIWSLVSRRAEYRRAHGWFRIALRYYVAIIMLVYGGFKVIQSQFPPLTLEQVSQPLGTMAPMGLLWAFMGYSTTYASFTGFGESIGAFLLFFRRTTTAGALILVAVLSNVALLNYTFDVPVKQLSSNLLLAAIVLAAPDLQRLFDVFVLNRPTAPADLAFELPRRWMRRVRRVLKPLIIAVATCAPLVFSFFIHRRLLERPALYGIYDVDRFERNGTAIPRAVTETTRWHRVVVSRPGSISIRLMNDSVSSLNAVIDTVQHRVTLSSRDGSRIRSTLTYERLAGGALRMRGLQGADSIGVSLRRLDERKLFRLLH
jgi:hypothetical protein